MVRGIRGATTVPANEADAIISATKELLLQIQRDNELQVDDICSIFFSVTPDLTAAFPARAARELGWQYVPLLDLQEARNDGDLARCIRVMVLANTAVPQAAIRHVYAGEARGLRPDLLRR